MRTFGFRIVLSGLTQASEGLAHALYEAGCTDTSLRSCKGVVSVRFRRESDSLDTAMLDARDQVETAGYRVERIELDGSQLDALASDCGASMSIQHWR
ncbi:hypothetical protein [Rhodopirellula sp. SWK7]|uniref:hypothetical protein n=1 Tax=Rhodopirellula sp. SWK7 TaxID=595460 RepID=UPI0002BF2609|nr:hypothetical protein [Rhodopirellula sp. SWK7]EMI44423.1 hypothetical protein RRSWK_03224 [Rhodopirellula sp. SWK7]